MASEDEEEDVTIAMPTDEEQDELIALYESDPDEFRERIVEIIQSNIEEFDPLHRNQNNDASDTNMTKESFINTFDGTFKTELLNVIFDLIDINKAGHITNAALISFINHKPIHPRFETTQIVKYKYSIYCQYTYCELPLL